MPLWKLLFGFIVVPALGVGKYLLAFFNSSQGVRGRDYAVAVVLWIFVSFLVFKGYQLGLKQKDKTSRATRDPR